MIVLGEHQRDLATHLHVSILPQTYLLSRLYYLIQVFALMSHLLYKKWGGFLFLYLCSSKHLKAFDIRVYGHLLTFPLNYFGTCTFWLVSLWYFPTFFFFFSYQLGQFRYSTALVNNYGNFHFLRQTFVYYSLWSKFYLPGLN